LKPTFLPAIAAFAVIASTPCLAFDTPAANSLAEARAELLAARYEHAAALYRALFNQSPSEGEGWYGLVRAQLGLHHARDAYASAVEALKSAPETPGAQVAAGMAAFREGDLSKAESYFRAALKLRANYPGGLRGMASIYTALSLAKTARDLRLNAYKQVPDDPELIAVYASTLKGDAHFKALEDALRIYDPASDEARRLRVRIANDRALGERKLRRLVTPYESGQVKLFRVLDGPNRERGVGLVLRLNGKQNARLLLDTGASGIALSPKLAEKAGLEVISGETGEAKGVGDQKPQASVAYLASEIRAGDVAFADYPISVFRSAQSPDYDGLIGADVFGRFIVSLDFNQLLLTVQPRDKNSEPDSDEPTDARPPSSGFSRMVRFGDHLTVPTFINGSTRSVLFLLDSGAQSNLIDTATAAEFASVSADSSVRVVGIQGSVKESARANRVSLVFAGFRQDNPDVIAISLERLGDDMGAGIGGVLGMPVLRNLTVSIDYREGAVKFEYKRP
jgi:tetratricopeptide (TPR) repeat protein